MAEIGDIIQAGESIPYDVVGVLDCDGDDLVLNARGHWHHPNSADPATCGTYQCGIDPTEYTPLTVTAVREPAPAPARKLIGPPHAHLDAPCTDACYEPAEQPDLIAQVMEALGVDRPEDVVDWIGELNTAIVEIKGERNAIRAERDEARAEVERLKSQVNSEIEQADERAAWADRLAWAALKRTGVRETEEASGNNELWQLALDALAVRPDPLVLSLPEVPKGTVAVTFPDNDDFPARAERLPDGLWRIDDTVYTLADLFVLAMNKELTVVSAPPREPRTWPKLDIDGDLPARVQVGSLRFLRMTDAGTYRSESSGGLWNWWSLRGQGDVTEVFDEPGGAS